MINTEKEMFDIEKKKEETGYKKPPIAKKISKTKTQEGDEENQPNEPISKPTASREKGVEGSEGSKAGYQPIKVKQAPVVKQ